MTKYDAMLNYVPHPENVGVEAWQHTLILALDAGKVIKLN
jgi:hypothetical protein